MKTLALALLLFVGCSKKQEAPKEAPKMTAAGLALGDATVFELVDRRWNKRETPTRDLVLHADGTFDLINDKTDKVMATLTVKADGSVVGDGRQLATIGEREIKDAAGGKTIASIDGNTLSLEVNDKMVKVVLAEDGNITVVDRPDGNKWRIDAKDPAVRRTAFLVLALQMETALD